MKKFISVLLATALLGSGGAALAHDDDAEQLDPVVQIVSEYDNADEQLDALLELRARIDEMIAQIGSADYAPLERNDINDDVTRLQERLIELGYMTRANGKYDNETVKAVKQFEKVNGLENDGKASVLDQLILFSASALTKDGQPATTVTDVNQTEPAPGDVKPDPDADKPDPSADKPDPDADKPDPDADKPNPDANKPNPNIANLDLDSYAPFDFAEYTADPEAFQDSMVQLEGNVLQLLNAQGDTGALILVTDDLQRIYVEADAQTLDGISGGNRLNVYARISSTYEYTTLTGESRTLPRAVADGIDVLS